MDPSQTAQTAGATKNQIVADKNKTAEQYMAEAEAFYIVPSLIRENFPDLIKLIFETESMDAEEREYWLQIMPIMSEEQIVKFREIMVNERDQLQKIDSQYNQQMSGMQAKKPVQKLDEAKLRERMEKLKAEESKSVADQADEEQALLDQLGQV